MHSITINILDWTKTESGGRQVGGRTWTTIPYQWLSLHGYYYQSVGSIQCTERTRETRKGEK